MTDKVTMKALDTFHASNVQADNLQAGDVFLVNEKDAKALEDRGLAERGGKAADAVNPPVEAAPRADTRDELDAERGQADGVKAIGVAPANKMTAPPENKAEALKKTASKKASAKGKKGK